MGKVRAFEFIVGDENMFKIVKCIKAIEELNVGEFNSLNIGVEIQDFIRISLDDKCNESKVNAYKELLRNFRNIVSLHGPFLDLRPASPDPDIRRISYNKYLKAINIAKELKANYIVFHSQINPHINEPSLKRTLYLQTRDFWIDIITESGYEGVILIENVFEDTPRLLREYIETINMPNVRINLDIGHAMLKESPLEYWIVELKDYIEYIHVHSNNGIYDEHKSPNTNEIKELKDLLQKYNINPVLSLEYVFDDLKDEINRLNLC